MSLKFRYISAASSNKVLQHLTVIMFFPLHFLLQLENKMQSDLFACQKKKEEEEAERDDRNVTMLNEVEEKKIQQMGSAASRRRLIPRQQYKE